MTEKLQTTKGLYGFPLISGLVYRFSTMTVKILMRLRWSVRSQIFFARAPDAAMLAYARSLQ